ncbi:MAG: hypothetical protein ACTHLW_16270 [Verrucomicrobiota bacterium]
MKTLGIISLVCLLAGHLAAQQAPHLAYVYPAGGRVGTTFNIVVGGQFLITASNAFVSGSGISARVLESSRPMNQKQFNELRDRLKALQDKFQASQRRGNHTNVWTAADAKERETIRAQILKNPPNRAANPAMIDTVTLRVSIATNAAPGEHEIRLATPATLSNPLLFCVGDLPELTKLAAKPANPDLDRFIEKLGGKPAPVGTPKYESRFAIPATLNGQIMPGGVDRYRFSATRGQQLVFAASARALIPYLADAVPGWFESVLTIYDSKGNELASAERFQCRPDPVLHFEVPRDGEYTVAIHDSIFRGREDFVYRLTVGELPFVTSIYPLGGRTGARVPVALTGWNLPEKNLALNNSAATPGVVSLTNNFFNSVPFDLADLPETTERKTAKGSQAAQTVTLPVIINGRIEHPSEQDVFQFDGRAGQQIVAEVIARRLDSPLDSFLRLTDASGKQLAFNDDFEDKGCGLNTHHADSYLMATLPADGTYLIHLSDTQGQSGSDYSYRLRLSEPRPDFALRVVPSSVSLRAGMSAPVTVFALRRDGFTNAIQLDFNDAPTGFSLSGARIPENQDQAKFTLKAVLAEENPVAISIEGNALIDGKRVSHLATPAEDMMQAFIYRHLVPSKELAVLVSGGQRLFQRDAFKIVSATPVKIPVGGNARVRVSTPPGGFGDRFKLELENAPDGISLASVSPVSGGVELVVSCASEKARPGVSGNLICNVSQKNQSPNAKKKTGNQSRRGPFASLPAIPFTIVSE